MAKAYQSNILDGLHAPNWGVLFNLPSARIYCRTHMSKGPDGPTAMVVIDANRVMFKADSESEFPYSHFSEILPTNPPMINLYHSFSDGSYQKNPHLEKFKTLCEELNSLITGPHAELQIVLAFSAAAYILFLIPHTPSPALSTATGDSAPWIPTQKSKKDGE